MQRAGIRFRDRIESSLYAGIVGDAMGAPTEQRTMDQILDRFGGPVRRLHTPPADSPFAAGRRLGQITDDTGQMIAMARAEIASRGRLTVRHVVEHLISWAGDEEVVTRFAGPTTMHTIRRLIQGEAPDVVGRSQTNSLSGTTNGAAMRVSPAGLAHPGDVEAAVYDAVLMALPTHGTQIAFSGAAAVAAAIAASFRNDADVASVIEAGITGARMGAEIGLSRARVVPGPSLAARIELAVDLVSHGSGDVLDRCRTLCDYVGCSVLMSESVPAAFGILSVTGASPFEGVVAAANIGGDTDTIGMIVGSIAGALTGNHDDIPTEIITTVTEVNGLEVEELVAGLAGLSEAEGDRR